MPADARVVLMDGRIELYVRTNTEQPIWQALLRFTDHEPLRRSLKTTDIHVARQRAVDLWHELASRLRRGLSSEAHTFAEACAGLMEEVTGWRVADYRQTIDRYLLPYMGERRVDEIGNADIQDWIAWRRRYWTEGPGRDITHISYMREGRWVRRGISRRIKTISPSRLASELSIIAAVFKWAQLRGWVAEPPLIVRPKVKQRRRPHFTMRELVTLRRASRKRYIETTHGHLRWERQVFHHWFAIMYLTGMRPVEAANLRWTDVEWGRCLWVRGKGKRRELIPLRAAWRHLRLLREIVEGDKVFPSSLKHQMVNFLAEVGLRHDPYGDPRTAYSLRHTYATNMLAVRHVPIHTLAINMGTSVEMVERHYSHLTAHQARSMLE